MEINYTLSPYPTLHENLVAIVYEILNSGAVTEVDRLIIPERNSSGIPTVGAGHQVPYAVSFSGLDRLVHEIRLYTASGGLLHWYHEQPKENVVTVFDPIRFRIGDGQANTPAAGDTSFHHPLLTGLLPTEYKAYRNGYGFVFEGVQIADNGDGFDLIQTGDLFSENEEWVIEKNSIVVSNPVNDSVVGKQFGPTAGNANMFVDITASVDYDSTIHLRKLIRMAGNAAAFHFRADPPIGYVFRFTNVGAYAALTDVPKVYFDNATLISGNAAVASFDLPFGTICEFSFDGTSWNKTIVNIGEAVPTALPKILATGYFNIGDVPSAITGWKITHNKNIVDDYFIFLSTQSNNTLDHSKDVKVSTAWWHDPVDKPNNFYLAAAELVGVAQNVAIAWMIVQ